MKYVSVATNTTRHNNTVSNMYYNILIHLTFISLSSEDFVPNSVESLFEWAIWMSVKLVVWLGILSWIIFDLVVFSPSSAGLQQLFITCSDYGLEHDILYNPDNSVVYDLQN